MLKIFDSNAEHAAIERVFAELKQNNTPGSKHIIITPDRFSLSVEKKVFEALGIDGAFDIEVFSFTNLARRALKTLPRCLSKEGTVMLLKRVLEQEAENLTYYRKVTHLKTFPKELFAVIASIRNSAITPEKLMRAFEGREDLTAKKYRDIAYLYGRYQEELNKKYIDTTGRLDALIERAGELPEITDSHFYLVGFLFFNKKQWQIIEALTKAAKSVNISASTFSGGSNEALFSNAVLTNANAIKARVGTELEIERIQKKLPEPLGSVCQNAFSYRQGVIAGDDKVTLFRQNTMYDELKAAGREIARLVRREGYRYRDIALIHYDDSYKSVVRDVFGRLQIPYFSDEKYPLKTVCSVRYLFEALQVLCENYRRKAVLNFIKNPLFPAEKAALDGFENYILKYNIDFNRFLSPFIKGTDEELRAAEAVRSVLLKSVPAFPASALVKEYTAAVRKFYSEELLAKEESLPEVGADAAYKNLHKQAFRLLSEQLEELDEVDGERFLPLQEFRELLLSAVLSVSVSLIPAKNDCVFVGTGEESALFDTKAIFIVGAAEGVVPQTQGYQAIMPERDVFQLEKAGVPLYPTPIDRLREEKARLVNLMTKAEERLYVSYSAYDLQGKPMQESEFLKELRAVTGWRLQKLSDKFALRAPYAAENTQDFLVTDENALYEYRYYLGSGRTADKPFYAGLERYLTGKGYNLSLASTDDGALPQSVTGVFLQQAEDGARYTSASQLETYAKCPYQHFFKYGLRVKERDEAKANSADVGTVIHKVLECYFKNTLGRLNKMSPAEVGAETERAVQEGFRSEKAEVLQETGYGKILFYALKTQLEALLPKLTDIVKASRYQPFLIEYSFHSAKGNGIVIDTAYGRVAANGKIDRVDVYDGKAVLIDYKTGAADAEFGNVYLGKKIQLFLYAIPLKRQGYRIAGSYYLRINDGYVKAGRDAQYVGNTAGAAAAQDLDTTYREGEWASGWYPFKNKTDRAGERLVSTANGNLLTEEQMDVAERFVYGTAKNTVEEFTEGYIEKRPLKGECAYCDYRALCLQKRPRKPFKVDVTDEGFVKKTKESADDGE